MPTNIARSGITQKHKMNFQNKDTSLITILSSHHGRHLTMDDFVVNKGILTNEISKKLSSMVNGSELGLVAG